MLLTIFLAIVFCAAISLMLLSAVAFIRKNSFFSSAPKEARAVLKSREKELFAGAHAMGWVLLVMSVLVMTGVFVIAAWDSIRSGYTFRQSFARFVTILTVYKLYDMTFFDWFLLCRFHFFQHYYPEVEPVYNGRKYGFNLKSQLLKLLVIFPAASALAAWICTLFG